MNLQDTHIVTQDTAHNRKNILRIIIGIIALACPTVYAIVDYTKIDLSISPSKNLPTRQRVYLISFAHGEVHERNQNYLALSAINKGIDTIISYRKRHIGQEFYLQNKAVLDESMGAGCWLWKPYFILETLKKMESNDILLYVDAGAYLKGSVDPLVERLNSPDTTMLLFENFHSNRQHVKRDTFDIMEVDYKHRDDLQLDAAFLAIRKTPEACDFIEKWLEYCCIADAITDKPSKAPEFEDFKSHRNDQSILTLTRIKHPNPTIKLVKRHEDEWKTPINIFIHHRRRTAEKPMIYFD